MLVQIIRGNDRTNAERDTMQKASGLSAVEEARGMVEDQFQLDEAGLRVFLGVLTNIEFGEPTPPEVDPRIRPLLERFVKHLHEHPRT